MSIKDKSNINIKIDTKDGPDFAFAKVLSGVLEGTYGVLDKGQTAELSASINKWLDKLKSAPELSPMQHAAKAAADLMKGMVSPSQGVPGKTAHVAEIDLSHEQPKGRA